MRLAPRDAIRPDEAACIEYKPMRYRLRTLLLIVALAPPVLAGLIAWAVLWWVHWHVPNYY